MKKRVGSLRKWLPFLLAAILAIGCAACYRNSASVATVSDVEFWGAPATEKVLRNVSGIYDAFKTDAVIDLTVARGEYEGAQIILSAKKDVTYDVQIGAIRMADGTEFPSANAEAFGEKYVDVTTNYSNNGMPLGQYPDALVPFANLKAAGENTVRANENQGVYFRFRIPLDQKVGVYSGAATVTIGGSTKSVPITLRVLDTKVSETSHNKSIFLNRWSFYRGELDGSQDMFNRYTEALFEYRLSPNEIVVDTKHSDEDVAYYTDLAFSYMQNPKCTNIQIPYQTTYVGNELSFDTNVFDKYLTAFAEKSFAAYESEEYDTCYNMFDKSTVYFSIIDEPHLQGLLNRVKLVSDAFRAQLTATADRIAADASVTSPVKDEIVQSIRKIRNVVTCPYDAVYAPYIDTWCPNVLYYDTENGRANYAGQEEKWWYTCNAPTPPYPTYRTEDTLLSARSLGWMQAQYNVTGNLYWATDIYAMYNTSAYVDIEEYYEGNASRYPNVNGDGYLFYPGKKYGVNGPIGSLRLEAIRDGLEEYELLYALESRYKEIAASHALDAETDALYGSLTNNIYNGVLVSATSEKFMSARAALLELCLLADSDAQFCLIGYNDDGYGENTYTFFAADGATVKNKGEALGVAEAVSGGNIYSLTVKLENARNDIALTVETGEDTYTFGMRLSGKVTVNGAADATADDFTEGGVTPTFTATDASTVDDEYEGTWAKIDLPQAEADGVQSFRMRGALINGIGSGSDRMLLHVYYDGDDAPTCAISAKYSKQAIQSRLATVDLHKGMNTITISLSSKNWSRLGTLDYFTIRLGEESTSAQTLYIVDTVVYNK